MCDRKGVYGRVVASSTELRGFVREAVGDVYRYALALTVSTTRAEQLAASAALRLARHVDAVGAAPVSTARLNLVVRREVLDSLPRRRRRRRHHAAPPLELTTSAPSALTVLAALDVEERVALVLRHYDGLLLPDIAAALSISYPEAESILGSARERLAPVIGAYDDGTGADAYGRLVRSVPGPADALADRVWVVVEAALVPDYADDEGWAVPDARDGEDPLGWDGFDAVPVAEHHVPPVREARRVGTTLLVGAGALAGLLAVAALTAPGSGDDDGGGAGVTSVPVRSAAGAPTTTASGDDEPAPSGPGTRGQQPPAEPDLVIDPGAVGPHQPDLVAPLSEAAIGPEPPRLADVAVRVRFRDGTSQVVVRRVPPDGGTEVWLISVAGRVRDTSAEDPEVLEGWAMEDGGVVLSMRVAGQPDIRVVAGLRSGGGGTWLRLPDGAEPLRARPDGSLLAVEPGQDGLNLTTYEVLS